ncbi:MAG: hypothetical protein AAGD10_16745 [Myxococcota bacterium]
MKWSLLVPLLTLACSENVKAPNRDWGQELAAEAVESKAEETLEPVTLPERAERFLTMGFEESRARLGPLRFTGEAELRIVRNGHDLSVGEKTVISAGPDGSVRIEQRDQDGHLTREGIRVGTQWYVRNGDGRLRTADIIHNERVRMLAEAYAPLALVHRLLGAAARWADRGPASVAGIKARRFEVQAGPTETISVGEHELRIVRVDGSVWIADAGPPVAYELSLGFRTAKAGAEEDGRLTLKLEGRLENIEARPFEVAEAVPPLKALEADLDPLGFLEDLTRTSTVIGG